MTHPLLTPRYEVIGDYPNSPFGVGCIVDFAEYPDFVSGNRVGNNRAPKSFFDNYPNIFRIMHWWEKRRIEEMPVWVKGKLLSKEPIGVFKVSWKKHGKHWLLVQDGYVVYSWFCDCNLQPATMDEFLDYLNTKK